MAMTEKFIPFAGFAPGAVEHGLGLLRAENALPLGGTWRSLPAYETGGGFLSSDPITGSYVHHYPSGVGTSSYVGDSQTEFHGLPGSLRTYAAGAFTDISRGGGYAAGALVPAGWRFASFGNDVWATNWVDPLQRRTDNAGNFADGVTSTFSPVCRDLIVVREFMLALSLNQVGRYADEFAWCDINDAAHYDPADSARPDSLAGSKRVVSRPGQLLRGIGGEYARLFKRRSIHALQFTAGDDIFRLDEVSSSIGLYWPGSLVECKDESARFWGGDAFYAQGGFSPPQRISPPSLNSFLTEYELDTVWNYSMDRTWPTRAWHEDLYMQGWQSASGLVFWAYRTKNRTNPGRMDKMIVHDPSSGEWDVINLGLGSSNGVSTILGDKVNTSGTTGILADLIATYFDGSTVSRLDFSGTSSLAATFATQRFRTMEGATTPPRITGVMPVFSTVPVSGAPDYRLTALPGGVQVHVVVANDPTFTQQSDDIGQVSPRYETYAVTDINDRGWLPFNSVGAWGMVVVEWPAGADDFRGLTGVWVRMED